MPYEVEETPKIPKLESVDITDFSEFCNQPSQLLRKETAPHMSKRTEAQVLEDVTQEYLNSLDMANLPSVYNMTSELMARTIDEYELENSVKAKGQKWPERPSEYPDCPDDIRYLSNLLYCLRGLRSRPGI